MGGPGRTGTASAGEGAGTGPAPARAESVSRFKRFRSARNSATVWERRSRSFSNALLTILSSSAGKALLSCTAEVGALFKMASKMTAVVAPLNARSPVAISYSTAPKLKRSVRESTFSPRACSGDM